MTAVNTTASDWEDRSLPGPAEDLGQSGSAEETIWGIVSRIADQLSQGRKAIPVTEALIAAGLVERPDRLRRITRQNEEVLNRYFEQLDVEAFARRLGGEATQPLRQEAKGAAPLLASAAFGAAAVKGIEYLRRQSE